MDDDKHFSSVKRKPLRGQRFNLKFVSLSLGFILLVIMIGALVRNLIVNSGNSSASNEVKSVLSSDELQPYTSPTNDFTINMPGFPSVDEKKYKDGDFDVSETIYERSIENEKITYTVEVHDYSGHPIDEKKLLEDKLSNKVAGIPNARLASSFLDSYKGQSAVEAIITTPKDNTEGNNMYVRLMVHDSKAYIIYTNGANKVKFDQFANSLKFN